MEKVKDYPSYLDYPKPRKTITNANKIRSMSDEELAEWLSCNCTGDGYGNSTEDWLNWLRQEK